MKRIMLLLPVLLSSFLHAQLPGNVQADIVLKKVSGKLNSLQQVSYRQTRETMYYGENYHNLFNGSMYFDFSAPLNKIGFRFIGSSERDISIFNGTQKFHIDQQNKTIDSASVRSVADIESSSYLYHSLAMLRNLMPAILSKDSIHRSVTDTIVDQKDCYAVKIDCPPMMYFQLLNGILHSDKMEVRMQYFLLVDKTTMLPYRFTQKLIREKDDRDFVSTTYENIDTHPAIIAAGQWTYAGYAIDYRPYQAPVRKPIVKPGAVIPDFALPALTKTGTDEVSLHRYAGKVVLLDFWFRACGPCMKAMPAYNALQEKFGKDGFELITVNVGDTEEEVRFFYNKFQPKYAMLIGGDTLFESLGFTGCPSSALIGKDGKVVKTFFGFNEEAISQEIAALIQ